jgi:hypothetical protein
MSDNPIAIAIERNAKAVTLRPAVGQGTAVTKVRLRDGLACDIQEGPWTLVAGMTENYAMWAARLGVPIDSLEIEIQADYDVRGELGVRDDVRPGYSEVRYVVSVSSPASVEDVNRWLDSADRYSSWRDNIANAVPLVCERRVTSTVR